MDKIGKKNLQKQRLKSAIENGGSSVGKLIQKKSRNKYGAIAKEYNGVKYHSTKEADYAKKLDLLIKAKHIEKWERQITYKLEINGTLICKYILDFKIWYSNGSIKHIDIKGYKKRTSL